MLGNSDPRKCRSFEKPKHRTLRWQHVWELPGAGGLNFFSCAQQHHPKGLPAYKGLGEIPRGACFPVERRARRSCSRGSTECSANKTDGGGWKPAYQKPPSANLVVRSDDSIRVITGDDEKLRCARMDTVVVAIEVGEVRTTESAARDQVNT